MAEASSTACAPPRSIDEAGWLHPAIHCPSPNVDARPEGRTVDLLVVHNISLPPGQFGGGHIERFFSNRLACSADPYFTQIGALRVSAHALIARDGQLTQFVSLHDRAWHAGRSSYLGVPECNDYSIGIELEGVDDRPYSAAQYLALAATTALLMRHFPQLRPARMAGHSDVAPGRKTDPGPAFDWARLHRELAQVQGP